MPLNEISITLPWPPSVNHYKKIGRIVKTSTGKLYQQRINSDKVRIYFYQVWMKVMKMGAESTKYVDDATIMLDVSVDLYPPDKRRRDIDNGLKVLLDSLQHAGVYQDDYQIARLLVTRRSIIPHGEILVRIKPYAQS